jgi:hypothetical protein
MRFLLLLVLLVCSVFGCAPAPVGLLGDGAPEEDVVRDVAVADAAPPDAGPDAPEAPPPPDVAVADAAPEASGDAPAAPDAPNDAADAPEMPPSLARDVDHVEVWQSVDGGPMRLVAGGCGFTSRGVVSFASPRSRGTYTYPTGVGACAIVCEDPADSLGARGPAFEHRGPYGPPSSLRINVRIIGDLPDALCVGGVRVETYALGCPVTP